MHPDPSLPNLTRRRFLAAAALAAGGVAFARPGFGADARAADDPAMPSTALPVGSSPSPVEFSHFPSRLHAFVWRNWELVPADRLARVVGARASNIRRLGRAMGLSSPPRISQAQLRRSALTIIKRNWHLLPYDQLLDLLGWTPEQMAFTLREDDFLFVKLGNLKPRCAPLRFRPSDDVTRRREAEIAAIMAEGFSSGSSQRESLFSFVSELSSPPSKIESRSGASSFSPRFCYSFFALYGDPLLESAADPYPDGYLARLAASGVNGVWLQGVLNRLAPFPWDPALSTQHELRLRNLGSLVQRARRHGIGIYLYLNEPRAMPLAFYKLHPDLKGAVEGDYAALCTSHPEVQRYLRDSIALVARTVPDLAGIFTISASENLSNCWSHNRGESCPRCSRRDPADVIAETSRIFQDGLRQAGARTRLIAWDWGWPDASAERIIGALPDEVALMSVSEWSLPIERGGVKSAVGEYSISAVGPGPRARRHWEWARRRGLKVLAKVQVGNTWELSAVPYIPALENVARHAANLRGEQVDGLMLGWTLGGYPSPNLEVVAELGANPAVGPLEAMDAVARRRFGAALAPSVVSAWRRFSAAFSEYPFGGGLYFAPLQLGPANHLWLKPTGYAASMVGFPYDDLKAWCGDYPPEVFAAQLEKVADGFDQALADLRSESQSFRATRAQRRALDRELCVAEAASIHFRSASLQCRFVIARRALEKPALRDDTQPQARVIENILRAEINLARRLYELQRRDSRLGFEASNQYYYVPLDLAEKVLNCRDLLKHFAMLAEKQITNRPTGHILTNTGVWSPDGQWIVYDTRGDAAGEVFDGNRIEMVHVVTGGVRVLYESRNQACCGVATFHPRENRVVFILGPGNPTPDWQYSAFHREGLIVDAAEPDTSENLDARDLVPPFTPGALRGGSHVHVWDGAGEWVSFTYEDHVLALSSGASGSEPNQRNVGISVPGRPVRVSRTHARNRDGAYFSTVVTRTVASPRSGSDEISRAFEEGWVGANGYKRSDGSWQRRALAFQGLVTTAEGKQVAEVFIVDLPDDVTRAGEGPLEGTERRRPVPPKGVAQRRLTWTANRAYPGIQGPRHWLRSSPDGQRIACLMRDDAGVAQIWTVSPNGGDLRQLTRNPRPIASAFTWSPDGRKIAHVMDNSVCVTDALSGETVRLTPRSDDVSAPRPEACVFSPDGGRIAFVRRVPADNQEYNQVFVVSALRAGLP